MERIGQEDLDAGLPSAQLAGQPTQGGFGSGGGQAEFDLLLEGLGYLAPQSHNSGPIEPLLTP